MPTGLRSSGILETILHALHSCHAAMPRYHVTIRVAPEMLKHISKAGRYARIEHMAAPDDTGWITLGLLFEMEEAACGYLLSFGTQVEIVEPEDLRAKVVHLAESVAAFYGRSVV